MEDLFEMTILKVLDIEFDFQGVKDVIHPVIVKDDKDMILIDCAYPGYLSKVEDAIKAVGFKSSQVTKIIITHHDHDHMGAAADFKKKYPNVQIISSEVEKPYIEGSRKSLRLIQAEEFGKDLSEDKRVFADAFCRVLRKVKPVKVDTAIIGTTETNWCGGCEIIDTKGHTPGHISVYFKTLDTLITGDAAVFKGKELVIANPGFILDMDNAKKSLDMIIEYKAGRYICYH